MFAQHEGFWTKNLREIILFSKIFQIKRTMYEA